MTTKHRKLSSSSRHNSQQQLVLVPGLRLQYNNRVQLVSEAVLYYVSSMLVLRNKPNFNVKKNKKQVSNKENLRSKTRENQDDTRIISYVKAQHSSPA